MWCNKKGDFYLSVRHLSGAMKVSLHKDGNCFIGLTEKYWQEVPEGAKGKSRHLDRWHLKNDTLRRALQIVVPGVELRKFPAEEEPDMKWLTPPAEGEIAVVSIFLAPQHIEPDSWPGSRHGSEPLAYLGTESRAAWVVAFKEPYHTASRAQVDQFRTEFAAQSKVPPRVGLRSLFGAHDVDGGRMLVEIAWQDGGEENEAVLSTG
jgi:hypothetical protein